MFYFRPYPSISYRVPGQSTSIRATDITKRFSIANFIANAAITFDEYYVQDGERPDTVAYDYYQDYTMDWLVLLTNEIADPYFEWPLGYEQFNNYLRQKYGSVESTMTAVHHYEQIIQTHQTVIDGYGQRIIPEKTLIVDHTTYLTLADYERKIVTMFEYETQKNDNNRHIYLLDPNFLGVIKEQHPFVFDKGINLR